MSSETECLLRLIPDDGTRTALWMIGMIPRDIVLVSYTRERAFDELLLVSTHGRLMQVAWNNSSSRLRSTSLALHCSSSKSMASAKPRRLSVLAHMSGAVAPHVCSATSDLRWDLSASTTTTGSTSSFITLNLQARRISP